MSETKKQGQWVALVCRIPTTSPQTPEYEEETELLRQAGYETGVMDRGQTQHETQEQANAAKLEMVRRLCALDPNVKWSAIAFCVSVPTFR